MNASNIQPVALSPADAARYLSISRRSLSRLIASGQVIAKEMPGGRTARTLVDFDSLRSFYASVPSRVGARKGGAPMSTARQKSLPTLVTSNPDRGRLCAQGFKVKGESKMKAESVIIDRTRVVGEFVFVTHGDRALYIGTSLNDTADPLDA